MFGQRCNTFFGNICFGRQSSEERKETITLFLYLVGLPRCFIPVQARARHRGISGKIRAVGADSLSPPHIFISQNTEMCDEGGEGRRNERVGGNISYGATNTNGV